MIIQEPDPILHKECHQVKWTDIKSIAKSLEHESMEYQKDHQDMHVVGMAAPQIGKSVTMFYALGEIYINPHIICVGEPSMEVYEGCCSLQGIFKTNRYRTVKMDWTDVTRSRKHQTYTGDLAAIMQHETDHLKGILISDHSPLQHLP